MKKNQGRKSNSGPKSGPQYSVFGKMLPIHPLVVKIGQTISNKKHGGKSNGKVTN